EERPMHTMLRCLALAVALLVSGQEGHGQDTKKDAGLVGLPSDTLQEIDKASVKDLFQKMSQAQNMLSRPGQNLMRTRVLLDNLRQKADSQVKLLENDADVAAVRDALKLQDFKDRLGKVVVLTDDKAFDEELNKVLGEYKLEAGGLIKYV